MKIINLGSNYFTNYLLCFDQGNILVDAGNALSYKAFVKKLTKHNIKVEDIDYIFLTHTHKDHISYLKELLNNSRARLVCHSAARERLLSGTNADGKGFGKLTNLVVKLNTLSGIYHFPPFDIEGKADYAENNLDYFRQKGFDITILPLSGHTADSLGLLVGKDTIIAGDAVNHLSNSNFLPFMYEDKEQCLARIAELSKYDCTVYVGHGKPLSSAKLRTK